MNDQERELLRRAYEVLESADDAYYHEALLKEMREALGFPEPTPRTFTHRIVIDTSALHE